MGQTQTVFLPPWVPSTDAEKQHENDFRDAIMKLSAKAGNFVTPHELHTHPEFSFDWVDHRPFAEAAYRADHRLFRLLPRLVPKRCGRSPNTIPSPGPVQHLHAPTPGLAAALPQRFPVASQHLRGGVLAQLLLARVRGQAAI